jgi:outer membrane protein
MKKSLVLILCGVPVFGQALPTLSLKQAEQAALKNHPRVRAAQYEASAADERVIETRSRELPFVAGNVTGVGASDEARIAAGGLNNPIIYNRFASGFTASQLITDFGRTGNLVASSRMEAAAQHDVVDTAVADVLLRVDEAYFRTLRASAVLKVAEETVKARQVVADQVSLMAKSKLKSGLDVSFADVNLSDAKLLQVSAQNDVEAAYAELSAAMGEPGVRRYELVDDPLPPAPETDFGELMKTAIQKRPELEFLRAEQAAAERFASAEKDLVRPAISAVTAFGAIPGRETEYLASNHYAAAGVNVSVPVFNGRLFSARRREAEYRKMAVDQRLRDQEVQIARDVRRAWLEAQTAYQRLSLTAQLLDEAGKALDLAQARYEIGLSSIVELSQAQLAKTQAEIQNVSAKYDYDLRHAALEYQIGELR